MNTSSVVSISDKSRRQSGVRWFFALLAVAAFCSLSHAQRLDVETYVSEWMDDSRAEMRLRPARLGDVAPTRVSTNYDNWTDPLLGGRTGTRERFRIGTDEIGDDIHLIDNTGGRVSALGWSYANLNPSNFLTRFRLTFRWYESDAVTVIRAYSFNVNVNRRPNSGALVDGDPGFWDFLNLSLPDHFWFSMTFSEIQGIPTEDVGLLVAGPRTLGYSSAQYRNFTTGVTESFDDDQVNLALLFGTTVIPAPASCCVCFIAAIFRARHSRARQSYC